MIEAISNSTAQQPDAGRAPAAQDRRIGGRVVAAETALGRAATGGETARLRRTAGQLVSQIFFAPLLAEMRKLPFGREFSHGGRTEDIFGEQLDQRVADSAASSNPGGIVDAVMAQLSKLPGAAPRLPTPTTDAYRPVVPNLASFLDQRS